MNKAVAADWDRLQEVADARTAVLVRDGDRFNYQWSAGERTVRAWVEESAPRFGCQISPTTGEEYPVSFRCWNIEILTHLIDTVAPAGE